MREIHKSRRQGVIAGVIVGFAVASASAVLPGCEGGDAGQPSRGSISVPRKGVAETSKEEKGKAAPKGRPRGLN